MDELSQERLAEGRRVLADICAEANALREAVQAETDYGQFDGAATRASRDWDEAERLAGLPAEQLRCLMFAAAERFAQGEEYSVPGHLFWHISQRPPDLEVGDVRLLAVVSEPGRTRACYQPFELVVERTEQLLAAGALGAAALADTLADQVGTWNPMTYYGLVDAAYQHPQRFSQLRDKALDMAGRPPAWPPTEGAVGRDDGFGLAVIGFLGLAEDWPPGVAGLLTHCVTAKSARPLPRWEKACRRHLDAIGDPGEVVRQLLELLATAPPVIYLTESFGRHSVLLGYNEQLARGLVWAAGVLDLPWLPEVLRAVAVRCLRLCSGHVFRPTAVPGERVPYACFRSLARSGSDASLIALARIGRASTNRRVMRELTKSLEEVSARRGMSPASLADRLIPDHGLSAAGTLTIAAGAGGWTVQLDDRHGAVLTGPADGPAPGAMTEAVTDIRTTVSMTRAQLARSLPARVNGMSKTFWTATCAIRWPDGWRTGSPGRSRRPGVSPSPGSLVKAGALSGPSAGSSQSRQAPSSICCTRSPSALPRLMNCVRSPWSWAWCSRSASSGGKPTASARLSRAPACSPTATAGTSCGSGSSMAWPGAAAGVVGSCLAPGMAAIPQWPAGITPQPDCVHPGP